jgi:hypothetical protein
MLIPAPPVRKVTLCFPALGSALADPAHRRLGRVLGVAGGVGRRQVLAVAPGAPGALLMLPAAAVDADHAPIVAPGGKTGTGGHDL